ncbi:MAG: protein kinase [Pirellulaceae bacterium]|jgi:serine/threonine protein kinase/tetratricopeptide (TPR) repeat protein|nr:protein kinase [Pirellulaceae bacterium]
MTKNEGASFALLDEAAALGKRELVDAIWDDLRRRLEAGEVARAEDYLRRYFRETDEAECAVDVIYGEFLMRCELGESVDTDDFLTRFPECRRLLERQLRVRQAFHETGGSPELNSPPDDPGLADTDAANIARASSSTKYSEARDPKTAGASPGLPEQFELLHEVGRGSMGVVYKARQKRLNRFVALKMILAGEHAGERLLKRFHTEAEAVAKLQHPNIVQIYEVGEHEGLPYFALEFVDGGTLHQQLDGTPMSAAPAARLVRQLADAVAYAHQQGVIHRDLKPANVLLSATAHRAESTEPAGPRPAGKRGSSRAAADSDRGEESEEHGAWSPKITDFGLAKQIELDSGSTQTGDILGTPSYMAPEQATGEASDIGCAVDIYALGAILYEVITGGPPFRAASLVETLRQVRNQDPIPPSRFQSATPRDLETICLKCLQKLPARRYATAAQLADDLRRFLDGRPISARPVSSLERLESWVRRNKAIASSLAVTALVLVATTIGSLFVAAQFSILEGEQRELVAQKENQRKLAVQATITARAAQASASAKSQEAKDALDAAEEELLRRIAIQTKDRRSHNKLVEALQNSQSTATRAEDKLYASQMRLVSQLARDPAQFEDARRVLDEWSSDPPRRAKRGWEWFFFSGLVDGLDVQRAAGNEALPGELVAAGGERLDPANSDSATTTSAVSPDGKRVAVARENRLSMFAAESDLLLCHIDVPGVDVESIHWSPDGTELFLVGASEFRRLDVQDSLKKADHPDAALRMIRRANDLAATPEELVEAAQFAIRHNRYPPLIEPFKSAVAANPENDELASVYGRLLHLRRGRLRSDGRFAEAESVEKAAVEAFDASPVDTASPHKHIFNLDRFADSTVLRPTVAKSLGGAEMTVQSDGWIRVDGPEPENDTYELIAQLPTPRLERLQLRSWRHRDFDDATVNRATNYFQLSRLSIEYATDPSGPFRQLKIASIDVSTQSTRSPLVKSSNGGGELDVRWVCTGLQRYGQHVAIVGLDSDKPISERGFLRITMKFDDFSTEVSGAFGMFQVSVAPDGRSAKELIAANAIASPERARVFLVAAQGDLKDGASIDPNGSPFEETCYALWLARHDKNDEAIRHLERSLISRGGLVPGLGIAALVLETPAERFSVRDRYHAMRATVRSRTGDISGALDDLARVATHRDLTEDEWSRRGAMERQVGRWSDAVASSERASKLNPDSGPLKQSLATACVMLGQHEMDRGRPRESLEPLRRSIDLERELLDDPMLQYDRVRMHKLIAGRFALLSDAYRLLDESAPAKGAWRDALANAKRATELDERDGDGRMMYGILLLFGPYPELSDVSAALTQAKSALRVNNRDPAKWTLLGMARYGVADLPGALAAFDEADELDGRPRGAARIYRSLHRALIHRQLDDPRQARLWLRMAEQDYDAGSAVSYLDRRMLDQLFTKAKRAIGV